MKHGNEVVPDLDGMWLALKPLSRIECIGHNPHGDEIYSLGRMSFGMFRPTRCHCSLQGVLNLIHLFGKSNNMLEKSNETQSNKNNDAVPPPHACKRI